MTNDAISFECCKTFAGLVVSFENFPQLLRVVTRPGRSAKSLQGLAFALAAIGVAKSSIIVVMMVMEAIMMKLIDCS